MNSILSQLIKIEVINYARQLGSFLFCSLVQGRQTMHLKMDTQLRKGKNKSCVCGNGETVELAGANCIFKLELNVTEVHGSECLFIFGREVGRSSDHAIEKQEVDFEVIAERTSRKVTWKCNPLGRSKRAGASPNEGT